MQAKKPLDPPYEEISLPEFGQRAANSFNIERPKAGNLVLRGPCPRCHATMEFVAVDHGPRSRSEVLELALRQLLA